MVVEQLKLDLVHDGSDERLLATLEPGPDTGGTGADQSWRLNFDGFQLSTELKEKPRKLHDCLGVLGPDDDVAEYYQQQVEMLEGFNEMDALAERGFIPGMSKEEQENLAKSETLAIGISNVASMILFAAKVYASIRSGSLAIIASTLDSLLDLLSGFILWFTAFSMSTPNPCQYPIGKKCMQPLLSTHSLSLVCLSFWVDAYSMIYMLWMFVGSLDVSQKCFRCFFMSPISFYQSKIASYMNKACIGQWYCHFVLAQS